MPGDMVAFELKKPWRDGTEWISMSADAFLEDTRGDEQFAAQLLGISARTIYRKLAGEEADA